MKWYRLVSMPSRIHVSGIPVRRAFFRDAIEEYSLEEPIKVLVMGGALDWVL